MIKSLFKANADVHPASRETMRSKLHRTLLSLLTAALLLTSVPPIQASATEAVDYAAQAEERKNLPVDTDAIPGWPMGPVLGAEAAILVEAETGTVLYAKNIHEKLYPASITKILCALVASEHTSPDEIVTYSAHAIDAIDWRSDSNIGMQPGEQLTVEQSIYGLLVGSANEVGNALAEHVSGSIEAYVDLMNQKAAELGCTDSHFVTTNGIYDDDHYVSAYDMYLIGKAFFANEYLANAACTPNYSLEPNEHLHHPIQIHSKNQLYKGGTYEYEGLVGSKTGYTGEARQTLVSCAERNGMRLICVILKEESPEQFTDTVRLFDYGFDNFRLAKPAEEDTKYNITSNLPVRAGTDLFGSSATLMRMDPDATILLPANISCTQAESRLVPIHDSASDEIARIDYSYGGVDLGSASIRLNPPSEGVLAILSTGSLPDEQTAAGASEIPDTSEISDASEDPGATSPDVPKHLLLLKNIAAELTQFKESLGTNRIYINVLYLMILLAALYLIIFLFILILGAAAYSYSRRERRSKKRRTKARRNNSSDRKRRSGFGSFTPVGSGSSLDRESTARRRRRKNVRDSRRKDRENTTSSAPNAHAQSAPLAVIEDED